MKRFSWLVVLIVWVKFGFSQSLEVDYAKLGAKIFPTMYGIFFEEISHGGEGGLYAEMIRNRSFEDHVLPSGMTYKDGFVYPAPSPHYLTGKVKEVKKKWDIKDTSAWSLKLYNSAKAEMKVIDTKPLNANNPHYLQVSINSVDSKNVVAIANSGFWGISVVAGEKYNLRVFLNQAKDYKGTVTAKFVSADGKTIGSQTIKLDKADKWNEYNCQITASATDNKSTFQLAFDSKGTINVDFVSVFPDKTFKARKNGLRSDVAQLIADLKPAFIRWPGGCIVEGITVENRVKWKESLGDPSTRTGQFDLWGYRNTYGFGYHEYLQFCEDIQAAAMYVCNVGMACEFNTGDYCADSEVQPFIDDVLDAIEYAIGDVNTKWGAKRAAAGHPKPFPLKYIEIGNEAHGEIYNKRFNLFYKAIKAKYPQINCIACVGYDGLNTVPESKKIIEKTDIIDPHWYQDPEWFFNNTTIFDKYQPRNEYKIYVGEYACNRNVGAGAIYGALSEAAFIAGMERNSDLVTMSSYAPLFENSNQRNWAVNLIWIKNNQSFGRSSYFVQKLFSENRPTVNLDYTLSLPKKPETFEYKGSIGFSTYKTKVQFKDINIYSNDTKVYTADFKTKAADWTPIRGDWKVADNVYSQNDLEPARLTLLKAQNLESNYTLEFKARKNEGDEGFIIVFGAKDEKNYYEVNLGGWGNHHSAVEQIKNGGASAISQDYDVKIDSNRWYDVKMVVNGISVEVFLDGKSVLKFVKKDFYKQYAVAGLNQDNKEIVIKIVNAESTPFKPTINLKNATVESEGKLISLSSTSPDDENSFENPTKIVPITETFKGISNNFTIELKPYSFSILRIKCK